MPQNKLTFTNSLDHPLGSKAFELRCNSGRWTATNVAVLSWSSAAISGSQSVFSNPQTSEHSEEILLNLFESDLENLELDLSEITEISLYTERQPCQFHQGQGGAAAGHRQSKPPAALSGHAHVSFERLNCASRLQAKFSDFDIFYTASSNDEHEEFLKFAARWHALSQTQRAVMAHLLAVVVRDRKAARIHVQCAAGHGSFLWVLPPWESNQFVVMLKNVTCPVLACGKPLVALGRSTLKEHTIQWMNAKNLRVVNSFFPNVIE